MAAGGWRNTPRCYTTLMSKFDLLMWDARKNASEHRLRCKLRAEHVSADFFRRMIRGREAEIVIATAFSSSRSPIKVAFDK